LWWHVNENGSPERGNERRVTDELDRVAEALLAER